MKLLILVTLFGLSLSQHDPHTKHGRTSIVHLFEWRWQDIAAECERYLAPNGYGGVQVQFLHIYHTNSPLLTEIFSFFVLLTTVMSRGPDTVIICQLQYQRISVIIIDVLQDYSVLNKVMVISHLCNCWSSVSDLTYVYN